MKSSQAWARATRLGIVAAVALGATSALANVVVTPASGGTAILADQAADAPAPAWTKLGAIIIAESGSSAGRGDIQSGTLILKAPTGFEFNTAATPSIFWTTGRNIQNATVQVTDASTLTITLTVVGTTSTDRLTIGNPNGLQVRPTRGTPLASGNIYRPTSGGGTAPIVGIVAGPGGTSFGQLREIAGVAHHLAFQTYPPTNAIAGEAFSPQPVLLVRDQFANVRSATNGNADNSTVVTATATGGDGLLIGDTTLTANDGAVTFQNLGFSSIGTVTLLFGSGTLLGTNSPPIAVGPPAGTLWYENFSRPTEPGDLDPWIVKSGVWSITQGVLQAGTNPVVGYGQCRLTNIWTNFSAQVRLRFPTGAYGGGLAGRVNGATGARYAAWLYPESSPGGSNVLKLLKFTDWNYFSVVAQIPLAGVGTNTHTLKLAMQDNGVAAHLNGKRLLSYVDAAAAYYTNGAIGLEHWTDTNGYAMEFDDVMVNLPLDPVATNDTYSLAAGTSLTVPPPGVLTNDYTLVFDLNALWVAGPAHGTLTLQTNGGFTYTPSPLYSGVDTFTYRVTDGRSTSAVATVTLNVTANAPPVAANDAYAALSGASLIVAAPGVLSNDSDPEGKPLTAVLAGSPTRGKLTLNTNGGFVYVSTPGYSGSDSFSYRASDGVSNSALATVTINITAPASLFSDNFTRGTDPGPLTPWTVQSGDWTVTGGQLVATNESNGYGTLFWATNWTDYSVQARLLFPPAAYGGGLAGRLDAATGARYAAWIYPEGSKGGSRVLKLLKFSNWENFSVLQTVSLPEVGTNWHTLKLAFQGERIGVHFDGQRLISLADPAAPFLRGGITTEFWTDTNSYVLTFDDVLVRLPALPSATNDDYTIPSGSTLAVPAPGVLTNDTADTGLLSAWLASTPTNGTILLNTNGGFSYTSASGYVGADTFTYRVRDGFGTSAVARVSLTITSNSAPVAANDTFAGISGVPLVIAAPGVLANDTDAEGQPLSALLVNGPAQGTLSLNADGGFVYTSANGYVGTDAFTYRATDGGATSAVGTVSLSLSPAGPMLSDNFSRTNEPGTLAPWVIRAGVWTITQGVLRGGTNSPSSYAYVYVPTNWADCAIEGKIRFPTGGYGGGLGGRLNPATGARYAAWVYPAGSPGGSNVLKLIKFQTWSVFGYSNVVNAVMRQVALPNVGADWHTLKLIFEGARIRVFYDGAQVIDLTDAEGQPYLTGTVSAEMWTDTAGYTLTFDDVWLTLPTATETLAALSIVSNPNATVTITWQGAPSTPYRVLSATNLVPPVDWTPLATNTSGADGRWIFTDSTAGRPVRFYRAVRP